MKLIRGHFKSTDPDFFTYERISQILKNQEDAELLHKLDGYDSRKAFTEFGINKAIVARLKKLIEKWRK